MVPFVYLASACWSLQCLISTLTQAGGGALLFRFTGSVMLQRGRDAAGRYHWCVQGGPAVFRPHWVCPHSRVCAFPVYTAQASSCSIWSGPCIACGSGFWVLHKSTDLIGPAFCAFPGPSSSGSQELAGHTLPGCGAPSPLRGPSLSFRTPVRCVWLVSFSRELGSSRDPPGGCGPSRISGSLWLETGGLFAVW